VCKNYYLFPFPYPLPPYAIVLGAINIDVILQQVGMKGNRRNMENNSVSK
jgi:hypothetical protein